MTRVYAHIKDINARHDFTYNILVIKIAFKTLHNSLYDYKYANSIKPFHVSYFLYDLPTYISNYTTSE